MKKRRNNKPIKKILAKQSLYDRIKRVIQLGIQLNDKYGIILSTWIPVIMLIVTFVIGILGIVAVKKIDNSIILFCISYVIVFYLRNSFISLLNYTRYVMSFKVIIIVIQLFLCFTVLPTIITILTNISKDLNDKVLLIIPMGNYMAFNYLKNITLSYNSYSGFTRKTFKISITSISLCIIMQLCIVLGLLFGFSSINYICLKLSISKMALFIFLIFNLIGNILIVLLTFLKLNSIKNWNEIIIGKELYRYKHIKGKAKQIYKQGIGGIFFPIFKYYRYDEFKNFNIRLEWQLLADRLYKYSEPNSIDMMISNEFESNPLFRMYYATLTWEMSFRNIFKESYFLFGFLFIKRGITLLYKKNPIDSTILIAWGTFLIWGAIFGYVISLQTDGKFKVLNIFIIAAISLYNISNIIQYLNIYIKILPFDLAVFGYFYLSYRLMKKKVKKQYKYRYFDTHKLIIAN